MFRYGIQLYRGRGGRDNRGSITLQITGADAGAVRQLLDVGQTEHHKGASGIGKIRGHIEAGGGGPYHFCGVLQSGGTDGTPVWGQDMGLVSSHGEADSGVPHVFFAASDGETGEEATGWYLAAGREQDRSEGGGDSGCTDIHRQEPSNIDTIVGPLAHI